jgi:hypothetical protein
LCRSRFLAAPATSCGCCRRCCDASTQEFSLFGHLTIENMLNISRFETIVSELLRKYQSVPQQQDAQRGKRWPSPWSRKRGGAAQGPVQVPACDSPSTDEAEVNPVRSAACSLRAAEPWNKICAFSRV